MFKSRVRRIVYESPVRCVVPVRLFEPSGDSVRGHEDINESVRPVPARPVLGKSFLLEERRHRCNV